jgi:hypothetical protein
MEARPVKMKVSHEKLKVTDLEANPEEIEVVRERPVSP